MAVSEEIMLEAKEGRIETTPLLLTVVGCIIFGVLGSAWTLLQPSPTMAVLYNLSLSACALVLPVLSLNAIFIASALGKFKALSKWANPTSLTYLYAFTMAAMFYNNEATPHLQIMAIVGERYLFPSTSYSYVPSIMSPSVEVAELFRTGGHAVPWGEYVPTIFWWWMITTLPALFAISLSVIFRKRWTDFEKVPFPQTMVAYDLMKGLSGGKEREKRPMWTKLFAFGIVLGFAVQIPIFMTQVFPWFPDIYGWRTNTCFHGGTYVSRIRH
jgi:hypothetical protein